MTLPVLRMIGTLPEIRQQLKQAIEAQKPKKKIFIEKGLLLSVMNCNFTSLN